MPRILMQVIRFCINTKDHQVKKLMMLYWEVVPKYQEPTSDEILRAAGGHIPRKMLPEMILVCNALMNDLNHPNEYVRGSMLRFMCKINDEEILGPLIPSVKACVEHRHPYVRKNAALAVFHAHKLFGDALMPDAPEVIQMFLAAETDVGARRNAFLMLLNQNEEIAIEYLAENLDAVSGFGDGFMLLVLELTRRVCRRDPNQKSRFVRVIFAMLNSDSPAVSYEAAWTLVSLSSAPSAVRAAVTTYTSLLNSGKNDNNVKMIVLERLEELKAKHTKVLQESIMDILRGLSSPDLTICRKVLEVAIDTVTSRNVLDVVTLLKKEVAKTKDSDSNAEKGVAYRSMLIKAIHGCATRFPHVAELVVHTLMDFLSSEGAMQVVVFVRAIMEQYPDLRPSIMQKLLMTMDQVSSRNVMCVCLWILGEYSETAEILQEAFTDVMVQLGDPPFVKKMEEAKDPKAEDEPKLITKNVVLADGTYATQTVYSESKVKKDEDNTPSLRKMIVAGDVYLGSIIAASLTKMCLRAQDFSAELPPLTIKKMIVQSVLAMCGLVRMAEACNTAHQSNAADCKDRVTMCTRVLLDPKAAAGLKDAFLSEGRTSFSKFLKTLKEKETASGSGGAKGKSSSDKDGKDDGPVSQADDMIHFRQLRTQAQGGELDLDDGTDLERATGYAGSKSLQSELNHVYQLSGFSDPVYAEALVTVHDYDIRLEILVINRTPHTLSNLMVELNTMGDMKIVERPQSHTIGPLDQITIKASIKVSSTETGHIFGTIVYDDSAQGGNKVYINLNDIHMDIMDYIRPAVCTDEIFRSMWAEFEWENKVAISTSIDDLFGFLNHVVKSTNMTCLTPYDGSEKGNFLAANLYARRYVQC
jgi:coatomer subunit beta